MAWSDEHRAFVLEEYKLDTEAQVVSLYLLELTLLTTDTLFLEYYAVSIMDQYSDRFD
jgi:hypothetical protein